MCKPVGPRSSGTSKDRAQRSRKAPSALPARVRRPRFRPSNSGFPAHLRRRGYNPRHQKTPGGSRLEARADSARSPIAADPSPRPDMRRVHQLSTTTAARALAIASFALLRSRLPLLVAAGAGRRGRPARAARASPDPDRLHPVRADAARRRAVPPPHAAGRADRPCAITLFKIVFSPVPGGRRRRRASSRHLAHEWVILANLFGLLLGFALLSQHFEESRVPAMLPRFLPDDWKGGVRAAGDDLRAVVVPRQHRRRADRRHDGAPACSAARCTSATSRRSSRRRTPAARAASSATRRRR